MKLFRKLICLILTLMLVLPISWVYADETETLHPSDPVSETEMEQPQEETQAPAADSTAQDNAEVQPQEEGDDAVQAPAESPEEETAAEEIEPEEELIRIDDEALPMAEFTGGWALANLICMVLAALTGLAVLFRKQDGRESHISWTKALGSVVAICAAAVFLLTGDFTMPMVYTDAFTMPMAALALVNVAVLLFDLRRESRTN